MRRFLAILVLALLLIASASADGERLKVAASHSILADVVANIGGEHIELTTLIPKGADPHNFSPARAI